MSTIGHPLSDLINLITPYLLAQAKKDPFENTVRVKSFPQFQGSATPGLPKQQELVDLYGEVAGWDPTPDIAWGAAFGYFRATCIYQGIAARYAVRQASSEKARDNGLLRHAMGAFAWSLVEEAKAKSADKSKL